MRPARRLPIGLLQWESGCPELSSYPRLRLMFLPHQHTMYRLRTCPAITPRRGTTVRRPLLATGIVTETITVTASGIAITIIMTMMTIDG